MMNQFKKIFRRTPDDEEDLNIADLESEKGRLKAVLESFEETSEFYQREVILYAWMYIALTIITLVGTALTPLLLILLEKDSPHVKFWQALPSGIGGLAAAINVALRYRENWTQSYYTLSAIKNEYQKFTARASPDYATVKSTSEIIDAFQTRMSAYVMSEVESWRVMMLKSEVTPVTDQQTAPTLSKIKLDPLQISPNGSGTGVVSLTRAAPQGGVTVDLSSEGKVTLADKQIRIGSGETTGSFGFTVAPDASSGDKATIKATANGATTAANLTIK